MDEEVFSTRGQPTSLGSWRFPSGNSVDVSHARDADGNDHLFCEWENPPPLRPSDMAHYRTVIRPQIIARALEVTKRSNYASVTDLLMKEKPS